jgi:molybdopterin-guanine dinucleotide biosynthesis protein A
VNKMTRAALILAGGRAHRFQDKVGEWKDKALANLFGKPFLIHAVENVRDVVDEVVVCVNNETRAKQYAETLTEYGVRNVRMVVDENVRYIRGPNVAILTGLKAVKADSCLILPCDMPLMQPKVADYLLNRAEGFRVVVPMWSNGRLETLVMAVERNSVLEIVDTLCQLRRSRSDDIIRGALNVLLVSPLGQIRTLDPELKSFININSQEDLARLQTRQTQGSISEDKQLNLGALPTHELQSLRNAATLYNEDNFAEASVVFSSCADRLEKEKMFFWASLSRENESISLMQLSQQQSDPKHAAEKREKMKNVLLAAANDYGLEAEQFEANHCMFLAERAKRDRAWCESLAQGKLDSMERFPTR